MGNNNMAYLAEWTDTYGGDANYSWVKRATIKADGDTSDLALMRRAKSALGLSGLRGRTYQRGDMIEFRPYRMACVLFVTWSDYCSEEA
jgi:hypothetical protein